MAHFSIDEPRFLNVDSNISRLNRALNTDINSGGSLSKSSLDDLSPAESFKHKK